MTTLSSRYLSCSETAKLVRKALKTAFPAVKFSVRSSTYAGGASISVSWVDGPTRPAVEAVAGPFAGSGFDGMIDLKFSKEHWLTKDGRVRLAHSPGTEGSRGVYAAEMCAPPTADAELVHFGADFVFCNRTFSFAALQAAAEAVAREFGVAVPEVVDSPWGAHLNSSDYETQRLVMTHIHHLAL